MPRRAVSSERVSEAPRLMRMADLSRLSGLSRETIHFYLREGLLPRPQKGGRTVAFYTDEHVQRLAAIRRLREEKFLPLAVIRRLLASPRNERDVDVVSELLRLDPTSSRAEAVWPAPSADVRAEALSRGLLGPFRRDEATVDPAEARVLAIVSEATSLEPRARALTLADLDACADDLARLVTREVELFFDAVLEGADVSSALLALRAGRPTVARFIEAYRDLMLRRVVDEVLRAVQAGSEVIARAASVRLSASALAALGFERRTNELRAARSPHSVTSLAWHLAGAGAIDSLAALRLPSGASDEVRVLVAYAACEGARDVERLRELERAVARAPAFALGRILEAEASLVRALRGRSNDGSFVDQAVPALARLAATDPSRDAEPVARLLGFFHRGRIELALPAVLGRRRRGIDSLTRALAIAEDEALGIDPVARARIVLNAQLAIARARGEASEDDAARSSLACALEVDPEGPIREIVAAELASLDTLARR